MIALRSDLARPQDLDEDSYRGRIDLVAKLSVSLPDDIVRDIKEVARGNVSAFVAAAVRNELDRRRLRVLVQEMEDELGPVDETRVSQIRAMVAEIDAAARASEGEDL